MTETSSPAVPAELPLATGIGRPWTERFPGAVPPVVLGKRLQVRDDLRCRGLWPAERADGVAWRRLGPEPSAMILLGDIAATVGQVALVVLTRAAPEDYGPMRLYFDGKPLEWSEGSAPPDLLDRHPDAWAATATLPVPGERGDAPHRLDIRLDRTLPDTGQRPLRFVGPAFHSILFME